MTNFDRVVGLMGASVVAIACASPAMAQTRTYSIPAQNASSGVAALARQSDQQVLISARDAKGKKTREVRGEMTIEQAFAKLLAGSGLTAKRTGAGAWAVVQGGNADAAPARTEASASGSNVVAVPSARAGSIVDARTGAALKGALVEIVETGEKVSTGDLGDFRFPGKNGSYNLRISYLGYPEYEQFVDLKDGRPTAGILLSDGGGMNEIVVTAYQSARAQALNQERTKDNSSTIISSDLLGQFNGTTISDAMRRAPGVSFERDVDTGDGTNVTVRGLPSEFNQVTINGQQLPVGSGRNRNPNLANILADSVSKITINKTLTAAQDSSGTGGLIEIETASPLDRPRRYASVAVEGVKRGKGFGSDYSFGGTLSGRFGESENLGMSISFQRRKQDVLNVGYSISEAILPSYLPLDVDGSPMTSSEYLDPRAPFPFEPGVSSFFPQGVSLASTSLQSTTDALTVALEWKPFESTTWSIDYLSSRKRSDSSTKGARLSSIGFYVPTPIPALGGETRYARPIFFSGVNVDSQIRKNRKETADAISFRGDSEFEKWDISYRAGYSKSKEESPDRYSFSAGRNDASAGVSFNPNMALPGAFDPATGLFASFFGERTGSEFPKILLNAEGIAYISANESLLYSGGSKSSLRGASDIWTSEISVKRSFDNSIFKFIEFGFSTKLNNARSSEGVFTTYDPVYNYDDPALLPPISALGLVTQPFGYNSIIGDTSGLTLITDRSLEQFISDLPNLVQQGTYVTRFDNPETPPTAIRELELAGYIQAKLELGKVDALIGMRYNRVNVRSAFISSPNLVDENGFFDEGFQARFSAPGTARGRQENFLPRILLNWRLSETSVIRAGYFSTVSRPRIDQLTGTQTIFLNLFPSSGPNFNQPSLTIGKSNPNIKDSRTHNFDVSFERYFPSVGAIKIAGFYKIFSNLPESFESRGTESLEGIELPDDPRFQDLPDNIFVSVTEPYSSPYKAKSWGFEVSVERSLDFLHKYMRGMSVYANYTYADSSKVLPQQWFGSPVLDSDGVIIGRDVENYVVRNVSFDRQPKYSATAGLTYSRYGIDASIFYSIQGRRRTQYLRHALHEYDEGSDSLDMRVQYSTRLSGVDARFYLAGSDLLKGRSDARVTGTRGGSGETPRFYTRGTYLGGREISAGVTISF